MDDMAIDGQRRADDLFPHIPEIAAHPGGFVAFSSHPAASQNQ
jgi:hypothetical protein